ncbi:MAG: GNAT family N-acetyltransferase [Candidatus Omnitrophota bacterium]|nr:GNAT family N-acetyltransferase [Candidatus Omnitrophota bacterium]
MKTDLQQKVFQADEWLTKILAKNVYGLNAGLLKTPAQLKEVMGNLRDPAFVYAKVPTDDLKLAGWLQETGFRLVDTNVIFEKPVTDAVPQSGQHQVRHARPQDESEIVDLAGRGFQYSRFHLDWQIGSEQANAVKAQWARNFFRGQRGDQMVVAFREGKAAGFCQIILEKPDVLTIDLICTDPGLRRQGIGQDMIVFAQNKNPGMKTVRAGTQVSNIGSIHLYEKMGFRLTRAHYVFHYHKQK